MVHGRVRDVFTPSGDWLGWRRIVKSAILTKADGEVVCSRCLLATGPFTRLRGLLGRSGLDEGEGMLFRPTGSIHMFFMRFPIDAIFCSRELDVLDVVRDLRPWRMAGRRGAKVVIEVAAGAAAAVTAGDRLILQDRG